MTIADQGRLPALPGQVGIEHALIGAAELLQREGQWAGPLTEFGQQTGL